MNIVGLLKTWRKSREDFTEFGSRFRARNPLPCNFLSEVLPHMQEITPALYVDGVSAERAYDKLGTIEKYFIDHARDASSRYNDACRIGTCADVLLRTCEMPLGTRPTRSEVAAILLDKRRNAREMIRLEKGLSA